MKEIKDVKQPVQSRRRLLKMAAYAVPTVATLGLARKSAADNYSAGVWTTDKK